MTGVLATNEIWVCHLGQLPYAEATALQESLRTRRQAGELPDLLLLLEHPPTYTRGRRSGAQELPFPEDFYAAKGIELHDTDRGGRITYHGPGQLVGYPIMGVEDVIVHVRTIERAIVIALAETGIHAHARTQDGPDYTGVWVEGERKIASIGVHVSRGVSTHGFAVNVENDMEPFSWVVACGLPDVRMTSIALETDRTGDSLDCFRQRMAHAFCRTHDRRQRLVTPGRLGIAGAQPNSGARRAEPLEKIAAVHA